MKVGLIARTEERGLGRMTHAFWRHMAPERTLVIDMGELARGFAQDVARYPGATVVMFEDGRLPEAAVREWIEGLDVIYSAETYYDWRLVQWAREAGVATVCHVMPEFYRHGAERLPEPTTWWAPTAWRRRELPAGHVLVPVPVETDRWPEPPAPAAGPVRYLHVAGHRASGDRNGTMLVYQAARMMRERVTITLTCQDGRLPAHRPRGAQLEVITSGVADHAELYAGHHVLVMPRRYGGLCLPANEAAGAGLGLVMTHVSPNSDWPASLVPAEPGQVIHTQAGAIRAANAKVPALAHLLDQLAREPHTVQEMRERAYAWAQERSWEALAPLYEAELSRAAGL